MDALLSVPFFALPAAGPSIGDVAAFESLPEDVQLLARRVLGSGLSLGNGGLGVSAAEIEAYKRGWEDGIESCEIWGDSVPRDTRIIEALKRPW